MDDWDLEAIHSPIHQSSFIHPLIHPLIHHPSIFYPSSIHPLIYYSFIHYSCIHHSCIHPSVHYLSVHPPIIHSFIYLSSIQTSIYICTHTNIHTYTCHVSIHPFINSADICRMPTAHQAWLLVIGAEDTTMNTHKSFYSWILYSEES